jgi:hypothetical protein
MINRITLCLAVLATALTFSACDRPKTAVQVDKDTASAEQSATENTAKAEKEAAEKSASARSDVRDEQRDLGHVNAIQGQKVADTEAEGAHKIALARCEGLAGTAQKSCKDQADADFEAAKAKAKQVRADSDPKP